jgi:hypothetical protein
MKEETVDVIETRENGQVCYSRKLIGGLYQHYTSFKVPRSIWDKYVEARSAFEDARMAVKHCKRIPKDIKYLLTKLAEGEVVKFDDEGKVSIKKKA